MQNEPKNLVLIVIIIVILVISVSVWYYIKTNKITSPPPEDDNATYISIATDKTQYEQGEIVKIKIENKLNESIWYTKDLCPISCCNLSQYKNDKWETSGNPIHCLTVALPPSGKIPEVKPAELKINESIEVEWDMKMGRKSVESGRYKFSFSYGLDKNNFTEESSYSNDFMIQVVCELDNDNCAAGSKCVFDGLKNSYICKKILKIGEECEEDGRNYVDMCDKDEGLSCKPAEQSCGVFSTDGGQECFVTYRCEK